MFFVQQGLPCCMSCSCAIDRFFSERVPLISTHHLLPFSSTGVALSSWYVSFTFKSHRYMRAERLDCWHKTAIGQRGMALGRQRSHRMDIHAREDRLEQTFAKNCVSYLEN